jgi:glyoxylase-like metal-dependent hydrolase (beta-lactamase superfamily II)
MRKDTQSIVNSTKLTYDVFVNDPPPQDGLLPNGEPKLVSPEASTLIYGSEDAVLTDPGMTTDQARVLGDWVARKDSNLTDIFVTHGHGDHWFAAGLLAERFDARVVATAGTIAQMQVTAALRPLLWDKVYPGIPPTPITAVTVTDNCITLEGHYLVIAEVGHTDTSDTSVLHVPDLELVVAGDVIYNGVHMYLGEAWSSAGLGLGERRSTRSRPASRGISSAAIRTNSSTTTPSGPSRRRGNTSTTQTSS